MADTGKSASTEEFSIQRIIHCTSCQVRGTGFLPFSDGVCNRFCLPEKPLLRCPLPHVSQPWGADTRCSSGSSRSMSSLGRFPRGHVCRAEPADLPAKLQRALVKIKLSWAKPPLLGTAYPTNSKPAGCCLHLAHRQGLISILLKRSA